MRALFPAEQAPLPLKCETRICTQPSLPLHLIAGFLVYEHLYQLSVFPLRIPTQDLHLSVTHQELFTVKPSFSPQNMTTSLCVHHSPAELQQQPRAQAATSHYCNHQPEVSPSHHHYP